MAKGTTILCKRKECPKNLCGVCSAKIIDINDCEMVSKSNESVITERELLID